jgi:hypothetical protein
LIGIAGRVLDTPCHNKAHDKKYRCKDANAATFFKILWFLDLHGSSHSLRGTGPDTRLPDFPGSPVFQDRFFVKYILHFVI